MRTEPVSPYDFRQGRTTLLANRTEKLALVPFPVGHKHVSTTSKYMEASREDTGALLAEMQKKPLEG